MVTAKQFNSSVENKINFRDCLADYFATHTLDPENTLTCEACGKANRSEIQFKIKTRKLSYSNILTLAYSARHLNKIN